MNILFGSLSPELLRLNVSESTVLKSQLRVAQIEHYVSKRPVLKSELRVAQIEHYASERPVLKSQLKSCSD